MKSTLLALLLGLLAIHAPSAAVSAAQPPFPPNLVSQAVPAQADVSQPAVEAPARFSHTGSVIRGLVLIFSSPVLVVLFCLGLFRNRVGSATPLRRRLTWAAVWAGAPLACLSALGVPGVYLLGLVPFAALLDRMLGTSPAWYGYPIAAVGWALFGLLYAAGRQHILNHRAKKAVVLPAKPQP